MKKYIKPSINVVMLDTSHTLLSASDETLGVTSGTYSGTFNSRGGDFWDDEEEEE